MGESNQKKVKPCEHNYFPTRTKTQGGAMSVTEVRCAKCLTKIDIQKLEWKEENE